MSSSAQHKKSWSLLSQNEAIDKTMDKLSWAKLDLDLGELSIDLGGRPNIWIYRESFKVEPIPGKPKGLLPGLSELCIVTYFRLPKIDNEGRIYFTETGSFDADKLPAFIRPLKIVSSEHGAITRDQSIWNELRRMDPPSGQPLFAHRGQDAQNSSKQDDLASLIELAYVDNRDENTFTLYILQNVLTNECIVVRGDQFQKLTVNHVKSKKDFVGTTDNIVKIEDQDTIRFVGVNINNDDNDQGSTFDNVRKSSEINIYRHRPDSRSTEETTVSDYSIGVIGVVQRRAHIGDIVRDTRTPSLTEFFPDAPDAHLSSVSIEDWRRMDDKELRFLFESDDIEHYPGDI